MARVESVSGPIGARGLGKAKARKVIEEERICEQGGCGKRLSKYNLAKKCYTHRAGEHVRNRGKK